MSAKSWLRKKISAEIWEDLGENALTGIKLRAKYILNSFENMEWVIRNGFLKTRYLWRIFYFSK